MKNNYQYASLNINFREICELMKREKIDKYVQIICLLDITVKRQEIIVDDI